MSCFANPAKFRGFLANFMGSVLHKFVSVLQLDLLEK